MNKKIKRIFFDSGNVLMYPVTGYWFIPQVLIDHLENNNIDVESLLNHSNYSQAIDYLNKNHHVITEEEELDQFRKFYGILLKDIDMHNESLIEKCAYEKVSNFSEYPLYPDVEEYMRSISKKIKVGLISDAWPSLIEAYKHYDMHKFFDPFVVSSVYGTTKAEGKLFDVALRQINEKPEECIFVDDSIENCNVAREYGMMPVLFLKDDTRASKTDSYIIANSLYDIEKMIAGMI